MMRSSAIPPTTPKERGFSLLELLVSLVILVIVVLGMLTLFDRSNRMSRVESSVTDAQQNARYGSYQVVREVRMAGAGGLPASTTAGGVNQLAISLNLGSSTWGNAAQFLSNDVNVTSDTVCIGDSCGGPSAHHIRKGTDIIHIRGVISTPLYDLSASSWVPSATSGALTIQPCTKYIDPAAVAPCAPYGTNDMSLFPVGAPTQPAVGHLFVMTDALGNVGVGVVSAVNPTTSPQGTVATITLDLTNGYAQSLCQGGAFPTGLSTPSRGGVLDDRVYFVDDGPSAGKTCTAANQSQSPGPCHPVLSVADWVDGDSSATPFSTATVTPIVEDVEDLQAAYGVDFLTIKCSGSGSALTCTAPSPNGTLSAPLPDGAITIADASAYQTIVSGAAGSTAPNLDPSEDASGPGKDEWIWNVAGEPVSGTFDETSDLSNLKAIEVSVVAKGTNPDPKYTGLGALAWPVMDTAAQSVSQLTTPSFPYHRRVTTVKISLRNFMVQ